jgi:hypothetical protein
MGRTRRVAELLSCSCAFRPNPALGAALIQRSLAWKRSAVRVILKVLAALDISFPDSG